MHSMVDYGKAAGICEVSSSLEMLVRRTTYIPRDCYHSSSLYGALIPGDWRRGIILPLYKGKGDRSECKNHRGITLLSVYVEVFARGMLDRTKPVIHAKRRREQSGFTTGRSTTDLILAMNFLAHTRLEFRQPLYAAYVNLEEAFDWVDMQRCHFKLLEILGIYTTRKLFVCFAICIRRLSAVCDVIM